ncbi:hypothetical protein FNV43_RR09041 [Rhamnella rubrinervis]|uniref:Uncharacterized protein n=1 Tax=Rhamnella rubrinervis TaxID=2594499 RepID=A0A8K0MJU5_9ROSA|nr:hypothetical protein FNV43_RR09041 [Rhamnella rubrinervis]
MPTKYFQNHTSLVDTTTNTASGSSKKDNTRIRELLETLDLDHFGVVCLLLRFRIFRISDFGVELFVFDSGSRGFGNAEARIARLRIGGGVV